MKINSVVLASTLLGLTLLSSCGNEHMGVSDGSGGTAGSSMSSASAGSVPGFSAVQSIFQAKCASCHGAGKANPKDWSDYDTAASNKELIFQRAIVAKNMPVGGALSTSELRLIAAWVKGGAPRDVAVPPSAPPVAEAAVTPLPKPEFTVSSAPAAGGEINVAVVTTVPVPALAAPTVTAPAVAAQCSGCHGVNGISPAPMWPNLAGQNALYLTKQLNAFRSGERKDPTMNAFSSALSDKDIEALASYFSSLPRQ